MITKYPDTFGSYLNDLSFDVWNQQISVQPFSLYESTFTFALPARKWFIYHNGTEIAFDSNNPDTHVRSVNGAMQLDVDATVPHVRAISRECPKYQGNREYKHSTSIIMPNASSDATVRFGVRTEENGVYFECVSGVIYACRYSGGVVVQREVITIPSGIDITKGNVYDIRFQYRGVGSFEFFINLQKVHTFDMLGTLTALSMENPALPVYLEVIRNTTDCTVKCGCVDISAIGGKKPSQLYNSAYAENVTATSDTPIMVVYNPLLIGTETNSRSVTFNRLTVTNAKKATFKVWMTRDAAAITGATFKKLPDSFLECDSPDMDATAVRATAVNTALCTLVTTATVQALAQREITNPDLDRINFDIVRGDYLIVTCTAATGAADVVTEFGEEV